MTATPNALGIVTAVKRDVLHVSESCFPLEVFPAKMQEILLHWSEHQGFKLEYAAMSMLTVMAAALGNTHRIRIRGEWTTNAALYVILVGRPGTGKTPPLESAMRPLLELDEQRLEKFKKDMEDSQEQPKGKKGEEQPESKSPKPKLVKTVISDFTPEKMVLVHADNPRGIIIHVDEVMGLFNSANRYSSSPIIEQLLSVWSGSPLDYTRVSNPVPIHISKPCISIIGTTQTTRIQELLQKGFKENGLLDRILYVLPKSQQIPLWKVEDCIGDSQSQEDSTAISDKWQKIMQKVFDLDYHTYLFEGEEKKIPHVLSMDEEAAKVFVAWWNNIAARNNSIENDADVESRDMKLNTHVARLALLLQVARYACGESHLNFIDAESIKGAIMLNDYLEDSFARIKEVVDVDDNSDLLARFYDILPDAFSTREAKSFGKRVGICERNVANKLNDMLADGILRRVQHGYYAKVKPTGQEQVNPNPVTAESEQ